MRQPLEYYLNQPYPFIAVADPDGGYFVKFPDLPGCMTQVDDVGEIGSMADEIRQLWLESAYDTDIDIPLPSYPADFSGKFVVRLPRGLHRRLAEMAELEGVSLNQHVVALLAAGDAQHRIEKLLHRFEAQIGAGAEDSTPEPVAVGAPPDQASSAA